MKNILLTLSLLCITSMNLNSVTMSGLVSHAVGLDDNAENKNSAVTLVKYLQVNNHPDAKAALGALVRSKFFRNDLKAANDALAAVQVAATGIDASRYAGKTGNAALDEVSLMFVQENSPGFKIMQKTKGEAKAKEAAAKIEAAIEQIKKM